MPDDTIRLRDILWGGRVRSDFQGLVMCIGSEAAYSHSSHVSGGMMSSCEYHGYSFLDGGTHESRGYFNASCGVFITGELAHAYIFYKLGLDPKILLRDREYPSLKVLEAMVKYDKICVQVKE